MVWNFRKSTVSYEFEYVFLHLFLAHVLNPSHALARKPRKKNVILLLFLAFVPIFFSLFLVCAAVGRWLLLTLFVADFRLCCCWHFFRSLHQSSAFKFPLFILTTDVFIYTATIWVYVMACRCFISRKSFTLSIYWYISFSRFLYIFCVYTFCCCWLLLFRFVYIEMPTTHLNKTKEYFDTKFHSQSHARLMHAASFGSGLE